MNNSKQDALYIAVGKVVLGFQTMEILLSTILLRFHAEPNIGAVFVSEMSFRKKVDALQCIFKLFDIEPNDQDLITETCRAMYQAEEVRNVIVHTAWSVGGPKGWQKIKFTAKPKKGFSPNIDHSDLSEVVSAHTTITNATTQLIKLEKSILDVRALKIPDHKKKIFHDVKRDPKKTTHNS